MTSNETSQIEQPRLCMSWRIPGGWWKVTENGAGETMTLSGFNQELTQLHDAQLEAIIQVCSAALAARKISKPL